MYMFMMYSALMDYCYFKSIGHLNKLLLIVVHHFIGPVMSLINGLQPGED